ncbi:transcriptional regulator, TetR family [Marinactinospora thermotolerans DSM 45154]|uniref:Transcriptional regulator, TetR family n=1 Tax=Marinactinospora thermotolerans DSM 45154 TaxID=1122192 RepID=A0A1T4PDT1_9ACTN|nr:TetR/AcrR family transcriptional regulator [Marinactinospora thermotolerans]SJZ89521.1 transcriptional regulator, TetR family [Marinactinospora thermotolerans DSM 45154]
MKRTAEEAAATRARVLEAAILVFAEKGWKEATYEAIGARAGVTRGAVHHHFRDKTRLLEEAIATGWRRHAAPALEELTREDQPPARRLTGFLSTYLRLLAQDDAFRALAVTSVLVAPQVLEVGAGIEEKSRQTDRWADLILPLLGSKAQERRGLESRDALFAVMAFLHGVTVAAATAPHDLPSPGAASGIAHAVVSGLIPGQEEA